MTYVLVCITYKVRSRPLLAEEVGQAGGVELHPVPRLRPVQRGEVQSVRPAQQSMDWIFHNR